jgi:hypothetical protein
MVLWRGLFLPCDLLFGATPNKKQPMTDNLTNFMDRLHDSHHCAHERMKAACDRMNACSDCPANVTGFQ